MNFFQIITGQQGDPDFVYLKNQVVGIEGDSWRMSEGTSITQLYPPDARIEMGPRSRGIVVPSLIGNIYQLLIVHRSIKDLLQATGVPMECLPFALVDHKKRVASREHFIVNPIGTFDCIDFKASTIEYFDEDPSVIISIEKLVLDPRKLEKAPDFFRIDKNPRTYVVSQRLGKAIADLEPTNVSVHQLAQSTPGK